MNTSRDPDRLISTFLAEGQTELPDRVFDAVRSEIDRTRQRVVIGPWRSPDMNSLAKVAIAAAAVVVVAVVGINLLPASTGVGGGRQSRRHPHRRPCRPVADSRRLRRRRLRPFLHPACRSAATFAMEGVTFTVELTTPGWRSRQLPSAEATRTHRIPPPSSSGECTGWRLLDPCA
jgi:hypothetical protein